MRAFVLAAGQGTRLRPLTHDTPKVLVPVDGVPLLDRLVAWLAAHGTEAVGLNTHHLAGAVEAHLAALRRRFPAVAFRTFPEPALLGTGGALVNARAFWAEEPEALLLWNGDVLAECDPAALLAAHARGGALATLVTQRRPEASALRVDAVGRVCGLASARRGHRLAARPRGAMEARAYCGIAALSPGLLGRMERPGAFDLIDALLEAIAAGAEVRAHDLGDAAWGTCGTPEELRRLEADLRRRPAWRRACTPPGR